MARAKQPVSIDGIEFDAVMDESATYDADVPNYPVETGFSVSDTIILRSLTLSMTLYLTNTPVTWRNRTGAYPSKVQDVAKKLKDLYFKKTPVTVSTNDGTFSNMAITSFELAKNQENGSSMEIPISFQEIRVTESKTTTIPESYGKSGTTGTNAGTANIATNNAAQEQTQSDTGSKGSILYNLGSSLGLVGEKKSGGIVDMIDGLFGG